MPSNSEAAAAAERHAEWIAACDRYELAQDTGRTKAEMSALRAAVITAYEAL